jgi:hypothetical protein
MMASQPGVASLGAVRQVEPMSKGSHQIMSARPVRLLDDRRRTSTGASSSILSMAHEQHVKSCI